MYDGERIKREISVGFLPFILSKFKLGSVPEPRKGKKDYEKQEDIVDLSGSAAGIDYCHLCDHHTE